MWPQTSYHLLEVNTIDGLFKLFINSCFMGPILFPHHRHQINFPTLIQNPFLLHIFKNRSDVSKKKKKRYMRYKKTCISQLALHACRSHLELARILLWFLGRSSLSKPCKSRTSCGSVLNGNPGVSHLSGVTSTPAPHLQTFLLLDTLSSVS